jgi:transcriptional regulator with XRE-family HTH domain
MGISRFSNTLSVVIHDELKTTQGQFAKLVGITEPALSRYIRSIDRPGVEALEKIAKKLKPEMRARVVRAYLCDAIPPCTRGLVDITYKGAAQQTQSKIREDAPEYGSPNVPEKLHAAMRFLLGQAVTNPKIAQTIYSLAELAEPRPKRK